jgi:uncharacterized membrane protein
MLIVVVFFSWEVMLGIMRKKNYSFPWSIYVLQLIFEVQNATHLHASYWEQILQNFVQTGRILGIKITTKNKLEAKRITNLCKKFV